VPSIPQRQKTSAMARIYFIKDIIPKERGREAISEPKKEYGQFRQSFVLKEV